jgi:hypothetical protein
MSVRRDDFGAGYAGAIVVFIIIGVLQSHGQSDSHSVTWPDILFFLFLMAIFASCVVDLYKYWQRRKTDPEHSIIIKFSSREERDKFWKEAKK